MLIYAKIGQPRNRWSKTETKKAVAFKKINRNQNYRDQKRKGCEVAVKMPIWTLFFKV